MSNTTPRSKFIVKRRKNILALAGVFTAATITIDGVHAAPPQRLFSDTVTLPAHAKMPLKAIKARSRGVAIDFNAINADTLTLDLFDDTTVTAILDRIETINDRFSWVGHIEGQEGSSEVILAVRGRAMMGTVTLEDGRIFEIVYTGNQTHAVRQIDPGKTAPHSEPLAPDVSPEGDLATAAIASTDTPTAAASTGQVIDLMVVYTPKARTNAGGQAGIEAKIINAVTKANQAYLNSQVDMQLNLVKMAEVNYTETGNMSTSLSHITGTNDGKMDIVHSWRNQYGADQVALVTADANYCGIAYVMTSLGSWFAPYAFAVVHDDSKYNCLGSNTLAHELGHNQGNMHDPANSSYAGVYPYSYGYRICGVFHDIMSYGCSSPRIPYFSNPNIYYNGQPIGIANSQDTARSMNGTSATVASFRTSIAAMASVPTAPASMTAASDSSSSIALSWADNSGDEIGFKVQRSQDGVNWSEIASLGGNVTHFTNTGLSAGATYSYRVYAYNSIGNSAFSNTASATTTASSADTTPPSLKIVSPGNGSTVAGKVKISGNGSDNVKLQSLKLVIDGAVVASTSSTSIAYTWNTRPIKPGAHTISLVGSDAAGNSGQTSIQVYK
ncbi:reprolysin-like metallopeptidase [Methylocaldum marinum]|nr:M12 family metallo-peptidase [Methylocaldum marinum]